MPGFRNDNKVNKVYIKSFDMDAIRAGKIELPAGQVTLQDDVTPQPQDNTIHVVYSWRVPEEQTQGIIENSWYHASVITPDGKRMNVDLAHIARGLQTATNGGIPVIPADYKPKLVPTVASQNPVTFVHCGSSVFYPNAIKPVRAYLSQKPEGGLWASPVETNKGWEKWRAGEMDAHYEQDQRFEWQLKPGAQVLSITTMDDVAYLIQKYGMQMDYASGYLPDRGFGCHDIDWAAVAMDFDGVYYDFTKLSDTLFTWDCDSVVMFNGNMIQCLNPEQVKIAPKQEAQTQDVVTVYAIQHFKPQDVVQPGWLESLPPNTPGAMRIFVRDDVFAQQAFVDSHFRPKQLDNPESKYLTDTEVSVCHTIQLPADIYKFITDRVKPGEYGYLCPMPIPAEAIVRSEMSIRRTDFTFSERIPLEQAVEHVAAHLSVMDKAAAMVRDMSDEQIQELLINRLGAGIDAIDGIRGVARPATEQDMPYVIQFKQMFQELAQTDCSLETKFETALEMQQCMAFCEYHHNAPDKVSNHVNRFFDELKYITRHTDDSVREWTAKWTEFHHEHPEEFIPENEQIEIDD